MVDGLPDGDDVVAPDPRLAALLSQADVWEQPDPDGEDLIVAAIASEAAETSIESDATVVAMPRRRLWPALAAVAAALVLLGGFALFAGSDDGVDGVELALAGTDLAPDASAQVVVADTPQGTRIDLDLTGLPPAPAGSYYEAWLRQSPEIGVSAGTFHLRGGDGSVELWAGVTLDDYPLVTVTLRRKEREPSRPVVSC